MNDPANADKPTARKIIGSNSLATDHSQVEPNNVHDEAGIIAGESLDQVGAITASPAKAQPRVEPSTGRAAFFVGSGILLSRIIGLVRQRIFAHYFGVESAAADAFTAAFRIPNFLQNVFGEGALSASFIPVYAKLLAQGDEKEASRVASAVLGLLALITSIVVVAGILLSPYLIDTIAPGFEGERRELTIRLVRILFPGAGLLVLSAWCLGILNSHHRFFISYTAPVAWNLAIISSLIFFGGRVGQFRLAEIAAWGALVGSALQFGIQLPTVFRVIHRLRAVLDIANTHVRTVVRNFFPVFMSRGVIQISAFVDEIIASFLPLGAVSALTYAQSLYTLPVSLFGMSVSAAELPAMSRALGNAEQVAVALRSRLNSGLRRIAFFNCSLSYGVPYARGCDGRGALPNGEIRPRCGGLRLGHPRWFKHRPAGCDPGAPVLVHFLRYAKHPNAPGLCHRARRAGDGAWLSGRHSPAPGARSLPKWGVVGLTACGKHRGLD